MTREEALKILKDCRRRGFDRTTYFVDEYHTARDMAIKALEQEPKTGQWIVEVWNNREHHSCSVCQRVVDYEPCYHYCPYCGAKMIEPQESEVNNG